MKRFLTTGFLGAILGIVIGGAPADASLISRSFLDQALTDYATNTALDLKANQTDLTALSNKIGTLPSGSLTGNSPAMDELFKFTQDTDTPVYPNSLSDLINQLYGSNGMGAISALLHGFDSGGYNGTVGILPAMDLGFSATQIAKTAIATATEAKTAADANTAKIGDLPSGLTVANLYNDWTDSDGYRVLGLRIIEDKNFTAYNPRTGQLNETTDPYMGGLLGMLDQLFSSNGYEIADEVIAPFWYLTKQALSVGEIPHEKTVAGMIDEINTKIGTLPAEYATVGAALTAMKSDIDAKSLPSTSADGQYVLTAKKVGETISYTWVKMDLTNEEQSQ